MTNNTINNVPRDFTKRPVIIQAIKWTGDNLFDVIKFMSGAPSIETSIGAAKWKEYCDIVQDSGLIIKTLEGQHIATIGDMIIRGVKGEFYPCKPDIFDMTYELSAPSPAGVDGLEVVGHIDSDDDASGSYAVFKNDCDLRDGTELVRLSDAQAIIDGLRGEVERFTGLWELELARAQKAENDAAHFALTIDQQAQRIGELEGLLREWRRMPVGGFEPGRFGVIRGQTDAALSAGVGMVK